jgi:hypothetical protein
MAGSVDLPGKQGGLYEGKSLTGTRPDLKDLTAPIGSYDPTKWGPRHNPADGRKGYGWLGVLRRIDNPNNVSTEISVGTNINGKDMEIPLLVPTLNRQEVEHLLSTPEDKLDFDHPVMQSILNKASTHAENQINNGLAPWKD